LATTPWRAGVTPVVRLTWVGHVVLGKTVRTPSATAPRAASARSVGAFTRSSRQ